jgi:GNAT superfamily N-acetyltransferase
MKQTFLQWEMDSYLISTDPERLDLPRMHQFLASTYWAKDIPFDLIKRAVENSLVFGIFVRDASSENTHQIGGARVISDYSTFAYLSDVYVENEWRGKGLSKWLMRCVMAHPDLQALRRFALVTRDAHGLYEQFGFQATKQPQDWLEIKALNPYQKLE